MLTKKISKVVKLKERSYKILQPVRKAMEDYKQVNKEIDAEIDTQTATKEALLKQVSSIDSKVDSLQELKVENANWVNKLSNFLS